MNFLRQYSTWAATDSSAKSTPPQPGTATATARGAEKQLHQVSLTQPLFLPRHATANTATPVHILKHVSFSRPPDHISTKICNNNKHHQQTNKKKQ